MYGCFKLHKRLKARRRSMVNERRMIDFVPPTPQRIAEARRYHFPPSFSSSPPPPSPLCILLLLYSKMLTPGRHRGCMTWNTRNHTVHDDHMVILKYFCIFLLKTKKQKTKQN